MSTHQVGQAVFRATFSEDMEWEPFPAFPPSARLAVVVGDPSQAAPYVVRVKLPSGVKLMPHKHEEDRVYTVMSGVFYIGVGEQFDEAKLEAYPLGAVIVLPSGTPHFHWAKSGEYVTQVTAIGPISLDYIDPEDDRGAREPFPDDAVPMPLALTKVQALGFTQGPASWVRPGTLTGARVA